MCLMNIDICGNHNFNHIKYLIMVEKVYIVSDRIMAMAL